MEPTLRPGRLVIAMPLKGRVGDVVIARKDHREVIKRIDDIQPVIDGAYDVFLIGDNPDRSTDSRSYGLVAHHHIIGRVVWPRGLRKRSNKV